MKWDLAVSATSQATGQAQPAGLCAREPVKSELCPIE